jgi:RNA ligase
MITNIDLENSRVTSLINDGYLKLNKDPNSELQLLNYTDKAQFDKEWNEYTLECRGLIFDKNGTIIARPFGKFFNYEEVDNIPNSKFKVFQKLDGSLGIVYYYNKQWNIATRGSFNSDQAQYARENLMIEYKALIDKLDKNNTYLFEIIYPENRIVVDYNTSQRLVLLGCINTQTGIEIDIDNIEYPDKALTYSFEDFNSIIATQSEESKDEGYVIQFEDGSRLKMKYDKYKSLHKIMCNFTPRIVWESLKNNTPMDLSSVPDEFYNQVKEIQNKLNNEYKIKYDKMYSLYNSIPSELKNDKKSFAQYVMANHKEYQTYMFSFLMDKKQNIADSIWQEIKLIC